MNCPNCGAELKDGMKFCTECGTKLMAEQAAQPPMGQQGQRSEGAPDSQQPPMGQQGQRPEGAPDSQQPPMGQQGQRPEGAPDGQQPPMGQQGQRPEGAPNGQQPPMGQQPEQEAQPQDDDHVNETQNWHRPPRPQQAQPAPAQGAHEAQGPAPASGSGTVGYIGWIVLSVLLLLWGIGGGILGIALGVAALVFALKIRTCSRAGDFEGAKKARRTCIILLIAGLCGMIVTELIGCAALAFKYLF